MITLTATEIAQATDGSLEGISTEAAQQITCNFATTDSREVRESTLFLAKPGEQTDGHLFVPAAFETGASLALVERPIEQEDGTPYPQIVVNDMVLAMGRLAEFCVQKMREKSKLTVVGITGSAGKTTTKDLLAQIFATAGETIAPIGSYNGEVGVPLTVFRADENTRYLVIEMGADGLGHIEYLANIVRPDYGVILKVGTAHAGEFGGVDNIEKTKGELAEGVKLSLCLNDDDQRVRRMVSRATTPVTYFGIGTNNQQTDQHYERVYAQDVQTNNNGCPEFTLVFPDHSSYKVCSQLIGEHHVYNLLAAASVAYQAGISTEAIAQVLNTSQAVSRWRMQRTDRPDGITVINDAYNANPESMVAALRALAQLGRTQQRRTWAILGPMLELGEVSVAEHDKLGRYAVRMNISKIVAVGDIAQPIYNAAHLEGSWGEEATWVATVEEAYQLIRHEAQPEDILLFKSSHSAGLGKLGERVATVEKLLSEERDTNATQWLSAGEPSQQVNSDFDIQNMTENTLVQHKPEGDTTA
ncbi:UDP-N-acetylmuramoyl-tripeptide--D-alanyl-D-alanine ligase [Rothia sp. P13129]|uniref:UDP-N-acetylmuramoyl-tripeptide--D-alanyl-D- alanine ligase n=1 Tax=Rothia sp. P13129 TaxID=3402664 RepID=UPI003AC7FB04